jgi:hypothetical protein
MPHADELVAYLREWCTNQKGSRVGFRGTSPHRHYPHTHTLDVLELLLDQSSAITCTDVRNVGWPGGDQDLILPDLPAALDDGFEVVNASVEML